MTKKGLILAAGALLGLSAAANAQFTALHSGPLDSNGAAGDPLNGMFTFNYAGPAFEIGTIDFSGTLTEVNTSTWASEARWRITNPAGVTLDAQVTSTTGFTGSLSINSSINTSSPFSDAASSVGTWTFQAYENFDDAGDSLADSFWENISFTFNLWAPPPPPPPAFGGNFTSTPNVLTPGMAASGTTVWDHNNPQPGLTRGAGENSLGTRYPGFGWDNAGNEVAYRIEHGGGDLELSLTDLSSDLDMVLIDSSGMVSGVIANSEGNGGPTDESILLAGAAPGTYYVVVDTYLPSGDGSGYTLTYIPAPGALALMGLGGLVAGRRRR